MSPQNNLNEWKVTKEFNNQRIDYWLKKKISFITYPILCKFIRKGIVRVNGKRIRNSSILYTGDIIKFSRNIKQQNKSKNKENYNRKFSDFINELILFKNQDLIIINKPSGLAVQGGTKIKLNVDVMLDSLKFDSIERPRLVHRIDKETSGILLIARSLDSSKYFGELFKNRLIEKKYIALVHGSPKFKFGKVELSINYDNKELKSLTYFKRLCFKNNISLLVVKPITGRKHQIRYHLKSIGNPIIGETKFKNSKRIQNLYSNQLFLHAYSLNFKTSSGENKEFTAPLPRYFDPFMKEFKYLKLTKQDLSFDNLEIFKLIE